MKNHVAGLALGLCVLGAAALHAEPSLMENLGRGVVAVRTSPTEVFVGWRVLGTDAPDVAFNLYRATGGGAAVKLNADPLTGPSQYVDATADPAQANVYFVRPVVFGIEEAPSASFTLPAGSPVQPYLRVPLDVPPGGTTPIGEAYTYSANDASPGDLDGDGEYELVVKWDPSNAKDNSQEGYTGNVYLDAYTLAGARLWRIDLGRNIRAGAHYTQFIVYDLDGDGKAEVAAKTADGTVDGAGQVIGAAAADFRNAAGYVLSGPEFLTIFDGATGAALATTPYVVPRGTVGDWGDTYGNRVDRFLATVAYLDGQRPSLVMARGYYTRAVLAAWNWRDGTLTNVWTFDTGHTGTPNPWAGWRGQGNHNLSVGDVDGDGRDEIMYGAAAVDDDGTGLFTTGLGHGDAIHMSDMDPDRPGQEVFQPHESPGAYGPNALELRDARTGALIFGVQGAGDIGRGLALDVDPRYRGYEMWGAGPTGGMYTAQLSTPNALFGPRGIEISPNKPSINFGAWWDGDLLRELLDGTVISKWDWLAGSAVNVLAPAGVASNNGTKATPAVSADLLGDWREEVVWRETSSAALRIYTTTIPTTYRFYTLMHDRQYRQAIAWQQTAYNQPPHPSFFLGDGMAPPPVPDIVTSLRTLLGPAAPSFTTITEDTGASASDFVTADTTLVLAGSAPPDTTVTVTRLGVGVIGTAAADGSGQWSLDYTGTALPEGPTLFVGTSTDAEGTTGPQSARFTVTVDVTAPAPPVIATVSAEPGLVVSGTADAGTTVHVTLVGTGVVGSAPADVQGRWSFPYAGPALPPGAHTFTAAAADAAGNLSAPSAPVTVDTSVATPAILALQDDTGSSPSDGITSDNRLILTGTAGPGDGVSVTLAGAVIGTTMADGGGAWSLDHTATVLPDGVHAFRAAGTSGGATSPASAAFVVVVDTTAPLVVSVNRFNPSAATSNASSITFRVTFGESVSGVDAGDFTPVFGGGLTGTLSDVSASAGTIVDVTVSALSGQGTVRLDVNGLGTGIADAAGNELGAGFTAGQTFTRLLEGNGTWVLGTGAGLWSDNANWLDGIVGSGSGNTANFATLELVDDGVVHLDAPRTLGHLVFGDSDPASTASWIVDDNGVPENVLTLGVGPATVTVNALGAGATASLALPLGGTAGVTKLGPGTLVLARPNTLSGALNVNNGTLRLAAGSALNAGTGTINVGTTAGVHLHVAGGSLAATGLVTVGSGTGGGNVGGLFTLDSGTATFGPVRTNSDSGSTFRINGGTFSATDVNIRRNSAAAVDFNGGFIVNGGTVTVGTMGLGTNNSNGALTVAGGSLTATGAVTIANQTSANRGGAMRVIGGTFTSTDTVNGIVIARNAGTNVNNVGVASFTAGIATAEKITLGFDAAVTLGSATVNVDGGTLYLGSGGIVKNGAGAFATNLNFSGGVLGAKASWATSEPVMLPAGGNVTLKAADAADLAYDITLSGPISGAGGFAKAGPGTVTLTGASGFTGGVTVAGGVLRVDGSVGAGAAVTVGNDGTLAGGGTLARAIALAAGGTVRPGGSAPGSSLAAESLAWTGGTLSFDAAAGQYLALTGDLIRVAAGALRVAFSPAPLATGATYTLATYTSTNAAAGDFFADGLGEDRGVFLVGPSSLQFLVTGVGPTASYTHWAYVNGLPPGQDGPEQDPDGDGLRNLYEFVTASNPLQENVSGLRSSTVIVENKTYPAVAFLRRQDLGGVTTDVLAAPAVDFASLLGTEEVSATPRGDGTEDVVVRSAVPLTEQPNQFFRLSATLPLAAAATVASPPVGVMSRTLESGVSGMSLPLIDAELFVGLATRNGGEVLSFDSSHGSLGALLVPGGRYFVEVATGTLAGERLDVDTDATLASGDATVTLALGAGSYSTLATLPDDALMGARCVLRRHVTLARLQEMFVPGLAGSDSRRRADAVQVRENGRVVRYTLAADGSTWRRTGSEEDFRDKVLPPDESFEVRAQRARQFWRHAGGVRTNAFRKNLVRGPQAFATGFPVDLSPKQIGAFVDPAAPPRTRWTGRNVPGLADQIQLALRGPAPEELFYLRGDGITWRTVPDPTDVSEVPFLGPARAIVVRRLNPDATYRIASPVIP